MKDRHGAAHNEALPAAMESAGLILVRGCDGEEHAAGAQGCTSCSCARGRKGLSEGLRKGVGWAFNQSLVTVGAAATATQPCGARTMCYTVHTVSTAVPRDTMA